MLGFFMAGRGWFENSGRGCFPGLGKRGLWGKARASAYEVRHSVVFPTIGHGLVAQFAQRHFSGTLLQVPVKPL